MNPSTPTPPSASDGDKALAENLGIGNMGSEYMTVEKAGKLIRAHRLAVVAQAVKPLESERDSLQTRLKEALDSCAKNVQTSMGYVKENETLKALVVRLRGALVKCSQSFKAWNGGQVSSGHYFALEEAKKAVVDGLLAIPADLADRVCVKRSEWEKLNQQLFQANSRAEKLETACVLAVEGANGLRRHITFMHVSDEGQDDIKFHDIKVKRATDIVTRSTSKQP